jgi:hypothetical protein
MNNANGIEVTVMGPVMILDGKSYELKPSATLEEIKVVARHYRSHGRKVELKRAVVGTRIEPASARDARIFDAWKRNAGNEDDDGSWAEANPWTWKIVGKRTEDLTA